MDSLERLRRGLAAAASGPEPKWQEQTAATLRAATSHLRQWIKAGVGDRAPLGDAVARAVQEFCVRLQFSSVSSARYTCFGCADPIGNNRYRLIEDEHRFPRLLHCVDEYRKNPRPFRRCYRGLLRGYVTYDPEDDSAEPSGVKNWDLLRTYLSERVELIGTSASVEPEWVESIQRNRELLTDRAGREYGSRGLEGDLDYFESARNELEISDQSWVVRKFILAQLDAAAVKSDREYGQFLPQLCELLERHPIFLGEGLAGILERYRQCTPPELDVGLRDFSVSQWGNPWLKLNHKKWGRVSEAVRQMVSGWLKLKFMEKFFSLLAEDGTNDRRRLNFWLRYIDHIDDMHFALGNSAMNNSAADFRELRKEMHGRLLHLYAGGPPSNNAFIMRMGNFVIVEFGVSGNACFIFDIRRGLPFRLEKYVAGNGTELKSDSCEARLLHIDRSDGQWEHHFGRKLGQLLHVAPSEAVPRPQQPRADTVAAPIHDRAFTQTAFDLFARQHDLTVADRRPQGGALWVLLGDQDTPVAHQLRAWKFAFAASKKAWWRK